MKETIASKKSSPWGRKTFKANSGEEKLPFKRKKPWAGPGSYEWTFLRICFRTNVSTVLNNSNLTTVKAQKQNHIWLLWKCGAWLNGYITSKNHHLNSWWLGNVWVHRVDFLYLLPGWRVSELISKMYDVKDDVSVFCKRQVFWIFNP